MKNSVFVLQAYAMQSNVWAPLNGKQNIEKLFGEIRALQSNDCTTQKRNLRVTWGNFKLLVLSDIRS